VLPERELPCSLEAGANDSILFDVSPMANDDCGCPSGDHTHDTVVVNGRVRGMPGRCRLAGNLLGRHSTNDGAVQVLPSEDGESGDGEDHTSSLELRFLRHGPCRAESHAYPQQQVERYSARPEPWAPSEVHEGVERHVVRDADHESRDHHHPSEDSKSLGCVGEVAGRAVRTCRRRQTKPPHVLGQLEDSVNHGDRDCDIKKLDVAHVRDPPHHYQRPDNFGQ